MLFCIIMSTYSHAGEAMPLVNSWIFIILHWVIQRISSSWHALACLYLVHSGGRACCGHVLAQSCHVFADCYGAVFLCSYLSFHACLTECGNIILVNITWEYGRECSDYVYGLPFPCSYYVFLCHSDLVIYVSENWYASFLFWKRHPSFLHHFIIELLLPHQIPSGSHWSGKFNFTKEGFCGSSNLDLIFLSRIR